MCASFKEVSPEDIIPPEVDFREEADPEHLRFIAQSAAAEGNKLRRPIDVRMKDGKYQILTGQGLSRYQALLTIRPKVEKIGVLIHDLDDAHAIIYGLGEDAATKQHTPKERGKWVQYVLNHYGVNLSWIEESTGVPRTTMQYWLGKSAEFGSQVNKEPTSLEDLAPDETEDEKRAKSRFFDAVIGDSEDQFKKFAEEEHLKPIEALGKLARVGLVASQLNDLETTLKPKWGRIEKFMETKKMSLTMLINRAVDVYLTEEGF